MIKMECNVKKTVHFLHLLFAFNQGSMVAKAARDICTVISTNKILNILLNVGKKL